LASINQRSACRLTVLEFHDPILILAQKEKDSLGTHEFLEKHAINGCWKVANNKSQLTPLGKVANASNKEIDRVGSRESPGALGESDSTLVPGLGAVNSTTFNMPNESHYIASDALKLSNSNVESLGKLYDITLDPDKELGSVNELGDSDNSIVDVIGKSNDTTVDVLPESDITTVCATGTPTEAMAMNIVNAIEVDPRTPENDMDSDLVGENGMEVGEGKMEAANILYMMSKYHNPEDLDSWQVVNWTRLMHENDRQGLGSELKMRISPGKLLAGWNWVFQK
jgi:hypothetical protein